jgi:hypothetical protein
MSFFFGDGFDLYAQITDCGGYWDSAFGGTATLALSSSGRFAGGRGLANIGNNTAPYLTKTSGQNDAVHHISVAIQQVSALTGTNQVMNFGLYDGATAQCTIVFRSDGAILLTAGGPTGTTLATYVGAIAAINNWYQFEIEVVINNATGSISVRKNGAASNDFTATGLNTRASANNYANKIALGVNFSTFSQIIDDFLWRSDASSVAWVGDIRCYTRMPTSDASVQFTRSGSVAPVMPYVFGAVATPTIGAARYSPFTAACDGTIGSLLQSIAVAYTGNIKCTLFANASGAPGAILGSATPVANPIVGMNTFTFGTPVAVTRGTTYWVGFNTDTAIGNSWNYSSSGSTAGPYANSGAVSTTSYAAFPVANPAITTVGLGSPIFTANITPTTPANAALVADTATDYAGGYDYSSTVGQSDLYGISPIGSTPALTVGVTTRAYAQKSDAGNRSLAAQLQSSSTNVQSASTALGTSWNWIARNDLVDPATSAAWTASGVNNAQIGCVVTV